MKISPSLIHSPLFLGLTQEEIFSVINCFEGRISTYPKGNEILSMGDKITFIGTLITGKLAIFKEDAEGNRSLLTHLGPGDHFAEVFAFSGVPFSPVCVLAEEEVQVLLLPKDHFLPTCAKNCSFHSKLIQNLLQILSAKSLYLQSRMSFLGEKTLRKKILSYLQSFFKEEGVPFTIPFNREQLADYLCVDRSALSRELSNLKKEGLIDYHKNRFTLF